MQYIIELDRDATIKEIRQLISIDLIQLPRHQRRAVASKFGAMLNEHEIEQILATYLGLPNGYPLKGPFRDADGVWHLLFAAA